MKRFIDDLAAKLEETHPNGEYLAIGEPCTSISALWCPNCGDCSCYEYFAALSEEEGRIPPLPGDHHLNAPTCDLHAPDSEHGPERVRAPWLSGS